MIRIAFVLLLLAAPALAAPNLAGMWRETRVTDYQNGKPPPEVSTVCVPADILTDYAEQELQRYVMLMGRQFKNCLDGDEAHFDNGRQWAEVCDDAVMHLALFQNDDRHIRYRMTVEQEDRLHPAPPPRPTMTRETDMEWVSADCTGTHAEIRPRP